MKVGLFLTNQQHLETDMVRALDEQIAMVHAARDSGWDWTPLAARQALCSVANIT